MYDVYLSSTIAGGNKDLNSRLCSGFEKKDLAVFLPQRDIDQNSSPAEMCSADYRAMQASKKVVAIFANATPNFYVELGFAYGASIPMIGVIEKNHHKLIMTETMDIDWFAVEDAQQEQDYIASLIDLIIKSPDILNVLKAGRILMQPERDEGTGNWKYRVETPKIAVVFKFVQYKARSQVDGVKLITCWRK